MCLGAKPTAPNNRLNIASTPSHLFFYGLGHISWQRLGDVFSSTCTPSNVVPSLLHPWITAIPHSPPQRSALHRTLLHFLRLSLSPSLSLSPVILLATTCEWAEAPRFLWDGIMKAGKETPLMSPRLSKKRKQEIWAERRVGSGLLNRAVPTPRLITQPRTAHTANDRLSRKKDGSGGS